VSNDPAVRPDDLHDVIERRAVLGKIGVDQSWGKVGVRFKLKHVRIQDAKVQAEYSYL